MRLKFNNTESQHTACVDKINGINVVDVQHLLQLSVYRVISFAGYKGGENKGREAVFVPHCLDAIYSSHFHALVSPQK